MIAWTKECVSNVVYHFKSGNINWPMTIYLALVHTAAIVGILTIPSCRWETLLWAFLLWPLRYESFGAWVSNT
jgi:hypothetical protein